jgi:hypothetical protein
MCHVSPPGFTFFKCLFFSRNMFERCSYVQKVTLKIPVEPKKFTPIKKFHICYIWQLRTLKIHVEPKKFTPIKKIPYLLYLAITTVL